MKTAIEISAVGALALLLLGCPAPQAETAANQAAAVNPAASTPAPGAAQPEGAAAVSVTAPVLPAEITMPDGAVLAVVPASKVDGNPQQYAGAVAIAGQVLEVDSAQGVVILKDCPDASCATPAGNPPKDDCSCCAPAHLPLRLDPAAVDGTFPAVGDNIVVIASLSPTATGYNLDVQEIRAGETVLLTVKPGLPG